MDRVRIKKRRMVEHEKKGKKVKGYVGRQRLVLVGERREERGRR